MTTPNAVCVYCAASPGVSALYRDAAAEVGRLLGERGVRVVYGGGRVGLMGLVADAALAAGGPVTGIIPRALLEREVAHATLSRLHVVETMHERKEMMAALSDAFIVLPGGLGTLDEMFEIITWRHLGLIRRPIVIVNLAGYWDAIFALLDGGVAAGFVRPDYRTLFRVVTSVDAILPALVAQMHDDALVEKSS